MVLVPALAIALASAGCLGFLRKEEPAAIDPNANVPRIIDNKTIEERFSAIPRNYTFAGQLDLPAVTFYVNGTVDSAAVLSHEDRNDRGGNSYGGWESLTDISAQLPPGQPAELRLTLVTRNTPGNAADCDISVDVPGTKTSFDGSNSDSFNWKLPVQRMIVNTVGVPGANHLVGVECHDGQVTSGVPFDLRVDVHYAKDVFTPGVPYAFKVPGNASGIIIESVKAGGPEHLRAWFVIIGPDDELVQFVDFNDIAIPTESVFVPTTSPGEYVFYAYNMTGGFLAVKADAPVEDRAVRTLATSVRSEAVATGPAPGFAARDWLHDGTIVTPAGPAGGEFSFDSGGTFPLTITPFIAESGSTLMTHVEIATSKGLVSSLQRVLRHDDESGSLGYTQDRFNGEFLPMNLARGSFTVTVTNDSPDAAVGYTLTTYVR